MVVRGRRPRPQLEEDSVEDIVVPAPAGSWIVAAGVFLIHLNIPSFIFSYGVFLIRLNDERKPLLSSAVLPPFFYAASWFLTDPICRRVVSGHSSWAKYMAISGILIVAGSIIVNTLLRSVVLQICTYGILGGMGTSLVLSQADAVLNSHFPSQRGVVQGVCNASMALGHFGMPLLLNGLISVYGVEGGLLLQAGVILQAVIGAALLLPPGGGSPQLPNYGRPRAYSLFDDIELADMSFSNSHSGHSPLLPQRSWRNSGSTTDSGGLSSPIMQARRKNINGVDILPEIPEENEDNEDASEPSSSVPSTPVLMAHVIDWDEIDLGEKKISENVGKVYKFKKNKKSDEASSLSKWKSINLDSQRNLREHNKDDANSIPHTQSDPRNESNNSNFSDEFFSSLSLRKYNQERRFKSSFPRSINDRLQYYHSPFHRLRQVFSCSCCNWYCRFKLYVAVLNLPHWLKVFVMRPLLIAVREPKFLPAFCVNTVSRVSSVMFSVLVPSFVREKVWDISFQEMAFTVSVSAFTWLCFLLISPCFSNMKPRKYKYIYLFGCVVSLVGLYLLAVGSSHSSIIICSAIFGLGQGAVRSSMPIFLEAELGVSKFLMIQGPIEGLSGCLVLLLAIIVGVLLQHQDGLSQSIIVLAVLQTITGLLWLFAISVPKLRKHSRQGIKGWPPENDFMTPG